MSPIVTLAGATYLLKDESDMDARTEQNFGKDDGIKCHECGGKTFLSYDQGGGLISYDCEKCGAVTQVQYDDCDDEETDPDEEFWSGCDNEETD